MHDGSDKMMAQSGQRKMASRRPPAHRSVSLKQGSTAADGLHRQQIWPKQPSLAANPLSNSNSSGETSNVENWFDTSNKDVGARMASFNDSDSPFSFEDNNSPQSGPQPYPSFLPARPPLMMRHTGDSSSEDFRGVIDDLTIENKKLKKRLRKYEKARDPQLQKDKLFEVKVLGLSPEKKRELEETLRRFASNLDQSPDGGKQSSSVKAASARFRPAKLASKPTWADSAYGSMAISGKASTAHSTLGSHTTHSIQGSHPSTHLERPQSGGRNIQSYLQDIPEGWLPTQGAAMSQSSRKKLVVRRLEQIFGGGRGIDPGRSEQPQQQQEVSQSAAEADRSYWEARGQQARAEGIREAQIMDMEAEDSMEMIEIAVGNSAKDSIERQDFATQSSTEQRPTRPLDLDPHRAQDPSENIEYMKHLGFLEAAEIPAVAADDDGQNWIYLNLLVSMAQLHTVNVTTDFVKQAISDYSSKIELSSDGRKVRWRGVNDGAMLGDSSPESNQDRSSGGAACDTPYDGKRSRPPHLEADSSSGGPTPKKQQLLAPPKDKFAYTPLFARNVSSGSDSDVSMGDAESSQSSPDGHAATGISKRTGPANAQAGDGAIVFYNNNATFCTDLSGDRSQRLHPTPSVKYQRSTGTPLGSKRNKARSPSAQSSVKGSDASVFDVSSLSSSLVLGNDSKHDLNFPATQPSKRVAFAEPEVPILLEASGIGGVTPKDNMTITVARQYVNKPGPKPKPASRPSRLSNLLSTKPRASPRPRAERVISTHQKSIEPSPLPPASLHFGTNDDSESDSDAGGSDSRSGDHRQASDSKQSLPALAATSPRLAALAASDDSDDSQEDEDESEDDTDDQSLDFLAGVRAADPAAVRLKEREYDAEVAERLADDIPAGSSAATAGGGSGFTSPARTNDDDSIDDSDNGSGSDG